ncbi:MAG: tetratricopeptide repeat protein [Promethearchaeota archaeon]
MEPIGTITNYLKFISDEEKNVVSDIQESAMNYDDFARELAEYVCNSECSDELVFLAAKHALDTFNLRHLERISNIHKDCVLSRYYFMLIKAMITGQMNNEVLADTIDSTLNQHPPNWIALELLRHQFPIVEKQSKREGILQRVEAIVKNDESARCFSMVLPYLRAWDNFKGGDLEATKRCFQFAVSEARKNDNPRFGADSLVLSAMGDIDVVEEAKQLCDFLGTTDRHWSLWQLLGTYYEGNGEYDAAVLAYHKTIEAFELSHPLASRRHLPHILSRAYLMSGDPQSALEWANFALEADPIVSWNIPNAGPIMAHLRKALALLSLGRADEAVPHIDKGRELALTAGLERQLAELHVAEGLLDYWYGDVLNAIKQLEDALSVFKQHEHKPYTNMCLYQLARIEVENYEELKELQEPGDKSWLEEMRLYSLENECPGIHGLTLLLEAQLRIREGSFLEASAILEEANEFAVKPSMKFLRTQIETLRADMEAKC